MNTHTLEPILASHPFFSCIDAKYLSLLTGCAKNARFAKDAYLFREGQAADYFYLLRSGKVALELAGAGETLVIQTKEAGEVLGWSWLLPPYRWAFDARATEDVLALKLDGACLRKKCECDPLLDRDLLRRFSHILVQELQATRLQLLDVYGKPNRTAGPK